MQNAKSIYKYIRFFGSLRLLVIFLSLISLLMPIRLQWIQSEELLSWNNLAIEKYSAGETVHVNTKKEISLEDLLISSIEIKYNEAQANPALLGAATRAGGAVFKAIGSFKGLRSHLNKMSSVLLKPGHKATMSGELAHLPMRLSMDYLQMHLAMFLIAMTKLSELNMFDSEYSDLSPAAFSETFKGFNNTTGFINFGFFILGMIGFKHGFVEQIIKRVQPGKIPGSGGLWRWAMDLKYRAGGQSAAQIAKARGIPMQALGQAGTPVYTGLNNMAWGMAIGHMASSVTGTYVLNQEAIECAVRSKDWLDVNTGSEIGRKMISAMGLYPEKFHYSTGEEACEKWEENIKSAGEEALPGLVSLLSSAMLIQIISNKLIAPATMAVKAGNQRIAQVATNAVNKLKSSKKLATLGKALGVAVTAGGSVAGPVGWVTGRLVQFGIGWVGFTLLDEAVFQPGVNWVFTQFNEQSFASDIDNPFINQFKDYPNRVMSLLSAPNSLAAQENFKNYLDDVHYSAQKGRTVSTHESMLHYASWMEQQSQVISRYQLSHKYYSELIGLGMFLTQSQKYIQHPNLIETRLNEVATAVALAQAGKMNPEKLNGIAGLSSSYSLESVIDSLNREVEFLTSLKGTLAEGQGFVFPTFAQRVLLAKNEKNPEVSHTTMARALAGLRDSKPLFEALRKVIYEYLESANSAAEKETSDRRYILNYYEALGRTLGMLDSRQIKGFDVDLSEEELSAIAMKTPMNYRDSYVRLLDSLVEGLKYFSRPPTSADPKLKTLVGKVQGLMTQEPTPFTDAGYFFNTYFSTDPEVVSSVVGVEVEKVTGHFKTPTFASRWMVLAYCGPEQYLFKPKDHLTREEPTGAQKVLSLVPQFFGFIEGALNFLSLTPGKDSKGRNFLGDEFVPPRLRQHGDSQVTTSFCTETENPYPTSEIYKKPISLKINSSNGSDSEVKYTGIFDYFIPGVKNSGARYNNLLSDLSYESIDKDRPQDKIKVTDQSGFETWWNDKVSVPLGQQFETNYGQRYRRVALRIANDLLKEYNPNNSGPEYIRTGNSIVSSRQEYRLLVAALGELYRAANYQKAVIASQAPELIVACKDEVTMRYFSNPSKEALPGEDRYFALWTQALDQILKSKSDSVGLRQFRDKLPQLSPDRKRRYMVQMCQSLVGDFALAKGVPANSVNTSPQSVTSTLTKSLGLEGLSAFSGYSAKFEDPMTLMKALMNPQSPLAMSRFLKDSPRAEYLRMDFEFQKELTTKFDELEKSVVADLQAAQKALREGSNYMISKEHAAARAKDLKGKFNDAIQNLQMGESYISASKEDAQKVSMEDLEKDAFGFKKSIGFDQMHFLDSPLRSNIRNTISRLSSLYESLYGSVTQVNIALFDPKSLAEEAKAARGKSTPGGLRH